MLPELDDAQLRALHAVCALYLSETRWALSAGCCAPPSAQAEILQRRDACEAVIAGLPVLGVGGPSGERDGTR